jgi:hypothetical protein
MAKKLDNEKLYVIKEYLWEIEYKDLYDPTKAVKMYLMSDIIIPKKFKVFEFIKYIAHPTSRRCLKIKIHRKNRFLTSRF